MRDAISQVTSKRETYFKEYFHSLTNPIQTLYIHDIAIPNPVFEDRSITHGDYCTSNSLRGFTGEKRVLFDERVSELFLYLDQCKKVTNLLADLCNITSSQDVNAFYNMMENFYNSGSIPECVNEHPFWTEYSKQKLIDKLWG